MVLRVEQGKGLKDRYVMLSPKPGHRTGSFRPNWVRQNGGSALLNEHSRVVH